MGRGEWQDGKCISKERMRQNRNGNTRIIPYGGYEIQIRKWVRNDTDKTFSVIVYEPCSTGGFIKKRFSNLMTEADEAKAT